MPACSRIFTSLERRQRRLRRRLEDDRVAGGTSAGAIFHVGMAMGKFHGVIDRDDAERLPVV